MFFCEECRKKNNWPCSYIESFGNCELCNKAASCYSIASKDLPSTKPDYQKILNIKFKSNDLDRTLTIREFFIELLTELWEQEEGFSGKRPFGNGGWKRDVEKALIKAGVIENEDTKDFNKIILNCIKTL